MVYFIIVSNKSRSVSAKFCFYFPPQLHHLPVHSTVNILYLFYSQSNLTPETSNYKLYRQLKQTVLNVLNYRVCVLQFSNPNVVIVYVFIHI